MRTLTSALTGEILYPHQIWGRTTLVVTYMDGHVERVPNVAWLFLSEDHGFPDPIVVKDFTTLVVENDEQTVTMLGVRHYTYDHTGHDNPL